MGRMLDKAQAEAHIAEQRSVLNKFESMVSVLSDDEYICTECGNTRKVYYNDRLKYCYCENDD